MTCFPWVLALALAQVSGEDSHWVSVDQKEGACVLRDFGDRPDGSTHGVRVWFGREMMLNCSFYVASESWNQKQNAISAGGMFYGDHLPLYYGYNVAFFDREDNLIACGGGELPDRPPVRGRRATSVTRLMPIPKGAEKSVASYKVAYYESDTAIGALAWDKHEEFTAATTDGNTGRTKERSWPLWKSDGELRGSAFPVRAGSRSLPMAARKEWLAETTEAACSLKRPFSSPSGEKLELGIEAGDKLPLKAHCRLKLNRRSEIETWVNFENTTGQKVFGILYLAFFDQFGNLVGCTNAGEEAKPRATSPAVTVGDKPVPAPAAFEAIMPVPLPLGLAESITSYKATVYQSNRPIGDVPDAGR